MRPVTQSSEWYSEGVLDEWKKMANLANRDKMVGEEKETVEQTVSGN